MFWQLFIQSSSALYSLWLISPGNILLCEHLPPIFHACVTHHPYDCFSVCDPSDPGLDGGTGGEYYCALCAVRYGTHGTDFVNKFITTSLCSCHGSAPRGRSICLIIPCFMTLYDFFRSVLGKQASIAALAIDASMALTTTASG